MEDKQKVYVVLTNDLVKGVYVVGATLDHMKAQSLCDSECDKGRECWVEEEYLDE